MPAIPGGCCLRISDRARPGTPTSTGDRPRPQRRRGALCYPGIDRRLIHHRPGPIVALRAPWVPALGHGIQLGPKSAHARPTGQADHSRGASYRGAGSHRHGAPGVVNRARPAVVGENGLLTCYQGGDLGAPKAFPGGWHRQKLQRKASARHPIVDAGRHVGSWVIYAGATIPRGRITIGRASLDITGRQRLLHGTSVAARRVTFSSRANARAKG